MHMHNYMNHEYESVYESGPYAYKVLFHRCTVLQFSLLKIEGRWVKMANSEKLRLKIEIQASRSIFSLLKIEILPQLLMSLLRTERQEK